MFRRGTSSSGKIHYLNPVDIYIDGDTYQRGFN